MTHREVYNGISQHNGINEKQRNKPSERNLQLNVVNDNQHPESFHETETINDSIAKDNLIPSVNMVKKESNQMNSFGLNINQMDNTSNGNKSSYVTDTIRNGEPPKINCKEMS